MTDDKKTIIIDLATSTGDKALDDGTALIQARAFEAITKQVNAELSAVKKSLNSGQSKGTDSQRMVFFIDGTRGAGKSTFLRSVTKELTKTNTKNNPDNNRLELLIELDPTKVETGEHIFVSLLYALKKLVEEQQNGCCSTNYTDDYEVWHKQFKRLAGGIQLLNQNKNTLQDIDAEAFFDWGLERAKSGMEFADEFKKLIEKSRQLLKKDALVISIDDADTNFSKAREMLEIIRRYLDSPYLVILITGDLQLYSHIVLDFYYENMGDKFHSRNEHRREEQTKLIDHLESQYLKKLFPLHQRTHLTSLWNLKDDDYYWVNTSSNKDINELQKKTATELKKSGCVKLDDIIEQLITDGMFIQGYMDLSLYKEFILKQSLRSIVQLLQFYTRKNKKVSTSQQVAEGFRAAFRSSLHTHQVDVNALSASDMNALNDAVFRVVLEDGEFDTGCYLRPQPSKTSLRNCFVTLAAEVARHCQDRPDYAIDYILQGLGSIALYDLISDESWNKLDKKQKEQQFRSYFSIGRNENTLNWARHATSILAGKDSIGTGVFVIPENSSDAVLSQTFVLSRVNITDGNNTQTYASIFNILGLVVRFLSLSEGLKGTDDKNLIEVTKELEKYLYLVTVSESPWKDPHDKKSSQQNSNKIDDDVTLLAKNIIAWLEFVDSIKTQIKPSAVFLGKVWTRLYFSLLNASSSINTQIGMASLMELYAICLINAFFVEEFYYHLTEAQASDTAPSIKRTNPIHPVSANFLKKFDITKKRKEGVRIQKFPLTRVIGTCPLILGLIRNEYATTLLSAMQTQSKNELFQQKLGCDNSIFTALNSIIITKAAGNIVKPIFMFKKGNKQ